MSLPPFAYSLRFWEGISWLLAGVDALLVYFGVLPEVFLYSGAVILSAILAVLKFFNVTPELLAKGFKVKGFLGLKK